MSGKPTVPQVLPMVRELYRINAVGCCLHIVLDDGNVKDSHVAFCLKQAITVGHLGCVALALNILQMSKTQRLKLYRDNGKYDGT